MLIQNAAQSGQNFLSKSAVRLSAQPAEKMSRVECDKLENTAKKLELAGDTPAAVFVRSQQDEKESKIHTPRQKEIGKLQERIMKIQDKMVEVKNDDSLLPDEKKEKLKKLDEQLAPLQEKMQNLQAEELEKFKAQKEEKEKEEKKAEEKQQETPSAAPASEEERALSEAQNLDAGKLALSAAKFEQSDAALSLSKRLDSKATFWQHDLDDFIRHQMRPVNNPPPDPAIVAKRRDEIFSTKRAADRLEDAAAQAVEEGGDVLKEPQQSAKPSAMSTKDADKENQPLQRGPYNAIGTAPAPKSSANSAGSE